MVMANKNKKTHSRIPIRFLDEEDETTTETASSENQKDDPTPAADELGRASMYEDETEMQRRIDRGQEQTDAEGRERADDADAAGGPDPAEIEESRTDLDTTKPSADPAAAGATGGGQEKAEGEGARKSATGGAGPALAELIATRAELRRIEAELQQMQEEQQGLRDALTRRQADFENYRKRMERERSEIYNRVVGEVVAKLLPVIDNLQRAVAAEASFQAGESKEFRHFLQGVELINKQLDSVIETLGVEPVSSVGHPFDPHVHEAIATEESEEFEPDTVIEEVVRGYRLGDKLLRPAMVKVAK